MPELPEVEVTRRGLTPFIQQKRITQIRYSGKKLRTAVPFGMIVQRLQGKKILKVERRAKYLLFISETGDTLIIHLGMTGKLGIFEPSAPLAVHDHLIFSLDSGMQMRFNDTRRFGSVTLLTNQQSQVMEETFFRTTGPEPFSPECSPEYLKKRAGKTSQAIKIFIMNSSIVAGVGNIYANESLYAAGIHPAAKASGLGLKRWQNLLTNIREILLWAIDCGGSTISDFLNASGQQGYFQANFKVYGRENQPCPACMELIKKETIGGRASYFCPSCQKR